MVERFGIFREKVCLLESPDADRFLHENTQQAALGSAREVEHGAEDPGAAAAQRRIVALSPSCRAADQTKAHGGGRLHAIEYVLVQKHQSRIIVLFL